MRVGNHLQYGRRVERISKENLFMVLAMWMELSPLCQGKPDARAGAVLVMEENRLSSLAMDCTREGVHAVARLLMKHPKALKNSTIYTSRRPCSFCAKLLVQCGVRQLYYLPRTPEKNGKDVDRVDSLLKVAPLAHCYFVPHVSDKVGEDTIRNVPDDKKVPETPEKVAKFVNELMTQFWDETWMEEEAKVHWPACDDNMRPLFEEDFRAIMKWISAVTLPSRQPDNEFVRYKSDPKGSEEVAEKKDIFCHLLPIAAILQQRTDDPRRGVGAVIWKEDEIVATGWNGFPAKALHGEFPRASDKDKAVEEKKYPYVIHAEQNALLMRNTADISGSTLFVTKPPCHECVPLLKLEKVKTCVVEITEQKAEEEFNRKGGNLRYDAFRDEVKGGTFTCFVLKKPPVQPEIVKFDEGEARKRPHSEGASPGKKKKEGNKAINERWRSGARYAEAKK